MSIRTPPAPSPFLICPANFAIALAASPSAGTTDRPSSMPSDSACELRRFIAPLKLSIFFAAMSAAEPGTMMSLPEPPRSARSVLIPSVPAMVAAVDSFCLSLIPLKRLPSIETILATGLISPFALKMLMPRRSISAAAFLEGFAICTSVVFSEVPRSEPDWNLFAIEAITLIVSSKLNPAAAAAEPPCASACAKSFTSIEVALAAEARPSATWPASAPFSAKRLSDLTTVFAASAKSMSPACASAMVPDSAAMEVFASRPPFASSVNAPAASVAPTPVLAPRSRAALLIVFIVAVFALVTACSSLIFVSNLAAD